MWGAGTAPVGLSMQHPEQSNPWSAADISALKATRVLLVAVRSGWLADEPYGKQINAWNPGLEVPKDAP
jgi:hypothetical protein